MGVLEGIADFELHVRADRDEGDGFLLSGESFEVQPVADRADDSERGCQCQPKAAFHCVSFRLMSG